MNNFEVRNSNSPEKTDHTWRRVISLLCILSLLFSFSVTAFAEQEIAEGNASDEVPPSEDYILLSEEEFHELFDDDYTESSLSEAGEESDPDDTPDAPQESILPEDEQYETEEDLYDYGDSGEDVISEDGFSEADDELYDYGDYDYDDSDDLWEEFLLEEETIYGEQLLADQYGNLFQWPLRDGKQHDVTRMDQAKHDGIDVVCKVGTPVYPVADGEVWKIGNPCSHWRNKEKCPEGSGCGARGNYIVIRHKISGATYFSVYMHLKQYSNKEYNITTNQKVYATNPIALSGNSGASTGEHLHFEVYKSSSYLNNTSGEKPSYDVIRRTSFQYYMNNPDALKYMRFVEENGGGVAKSQYYSWIKANCKSEKVSKTKTKWYFKGTTDSNGVVTTPVVGSIVFSADGKHQYVRYDTSLKWTAAKAFCETKGGHLVTILNSTEQNDVKSVLTGCTKNVYFIGASHPETNKTFKWVTGESLSYNNWDKDKPEPTNGTGENYAAIMGKKVGSNKQFGEWIDICNDGEMGISGYTLYECGFICEFDYVLYDANGGTDGPSASQVKKFGTDLTLSTTKPKRTGYTFLGWSTNKNATTAEYAAGGTYKKNEAAKLYAVWQVNSLKIGYFVDKGAVTAPGYSINKASGSVMQGSSYLVDNWNYNVSKNLISAATLGLERPGYVFKGWKQLGSNTVYSPDKTMKAQELNPAVATLSGTTLKLYAAWEPVEVTSALSLPENLTTIESEAFLSIGADAIIVPACVETIGENAFSENTILIGEWDSPIQKYADDNSLAFIELEDYASNSAPSA